MDIYLIFVFILFALAITDLIVGVSNDAVNFLNSAIGSKVASRKTIMIIASVGILCGALFSNGMMEVARKGIFHPQHFYFTEIMVIFMAVMITDILLLDFFNTVGLPTSTTVSIVFEILGAAVAVTILKLSTGEQTIIIDGVEKIASLSDYINSAKALMIISGILLSVVVSFTVGALVMWLSRMAFSFNYGKPLKYFGAIWGGIAITAITYFILIKGAKSASFMTSDTKHMIQENTGLILLASFVFWAFLTQVLNWIFNTNILKVVVLAGTFALAMAFAGNDLVNFIGVPLAGFEAFKLSGGNDILMSGLAKKVATPSSFLFIAGGIMVLTLWFSKKARSVTETELNLSRQDEGYERFGSSVVARLLVRRAIGSDTFFSSVLPASFVSSVKSRFDQTDFNKKLQKQDNPPMFDLVRASVNLTVASILISFATSLKLPLSTTYVTFMVAMGTSLADGAWGRDSAVYRITGVFAVIGGWFMTALIAFTVSFLVAMFISWAGVWAVALLVAFAAFAIIKTTVSHKRKQEAKQQTINDEFAEPAASTGKVLEKCNKGVNRILESTISIINKSIEALINEDRKEIRAQLDEVDELTIKVKKQKINLPTTILDLQQDSIETGHHFVQIIDYQRELLHSLNYLVDPLYQHIENNHKKIVEVQVEELKDISAMINLFIRKVLDVVAKADYAQIDVVLEEQAAILDKLNAYRKKQIKRIKTKETGTRNSLLYLNMIVEFKNVVLNSVNILKAQRDFASYTEVKGDK